MCWPHPGWELSGTDIDPFLTFVAVGAQIVVAPGLPERVREDSGDAKL